MIRPLQRGSLTSRLSENGWSHDENPLVFETNGKESEDCEQHGKTSLPSSYSVHVLTHKSQPKGVENGLRNGLRIQDMPAEVCTLKFLFGSFFSHFPDFSWLRFHPTGSSSPILNKRGLSVPLGKLIMLTFVSIFILIAVLGSSNAAYSASAAPRLLYRSYRRIQQEFSLDFTNGGIFGLGTFHPKDLTICPKDMEHNVPCYNVSSAHKAGFRKGEEYERHCELSDGRKQCLIRPPKDYRIPLRWPKSRSAVWSGNVKVARDQFQGKETKTERLWLGEDNTISFKSRDAEGAKTHFQDIATTIGVQNDGSFGQAGIHTVLDIGCSYGSFVDHLLSRNLLTLCVAPYESQNSQVQVALERGLPSMIGSLTTRQLPFPAFSFNMIHCTDCGIDWSQKDGLLLMEVDRLLKQDGYFVWMPPMWNHGRSLQSIDHDEKWKLIDQAAKNMCWSLIPQQGQAYVWRKTANHTCYAERIPSACNDDKGNDVVVYGRLQACLVAATEGGSLLAQQQSVWPNLPLSASGFSIEELTDDAAVWSATVKSYWSLITPLIFSDHPKRPAEDDPLPPSNIVRNVMDMNALFGGFNAALLQSGKSAWVMNVVPTSGPNTLPIIFKRGFVGALHNWCEAFPTYPRTYDLLHAVGLLSQEVGQTTGCSVSNLFLEMDRILRPEGWVLLRDNAELIEDARVAASQMRWEARVIEVEGDSDLRLLVCQKTFWKT